MMETRRHNIYGVDVTGRPENLDKAFEALNGYFETFAALERIAHIAGDMVDAGPKSYKAVQIWEVATAALRKAVGE